jgi:DegV family protein with EDD domain
VIKLVTDTTCDLPPDWLSRYRITVTPINIQFGLESFHEGVTITPDVFYERIRASGSLPTTSQPSVGEFCQVYEKLAADGSEILSIHLTSKLSGTWQSAVLAAKQVKDRARVTVVDSLTSSAGLGFMVREAAQLIEAGLTAEAIKAHLEEQRSEVKVFIMLRDLQYARMSGRVGRLRETLASLLQVKPIIGAEEGALIPLERVRGEKQGLAKIVALAEEAVKDRPIHLAVAHAQNPVQAEYLLAQAQARLNYRDSFITELAISLAVHFGPGTVGLATYPVQLSINNQ